MKLFLIIFLILSCSQCLKTKSKNSIIDQPQVQSILPANNVDGIGMKLLQKFLTQDDKSIKAKGGVYDETGMDGLDVSQEEQYEEGSDLKFRQRARSAANLYQQQNPKKGEVNFKSYGITEDEEKLEGWNSYIVLMMGDDGVHKLDKICVSIKPSVISYVIKTNEMCANAVPQAKPIKIPQISGDAQNLIRSLDINNIDGQDEESMIKKQIDALQKKMKIIKQQKKKQQLKPRFKESVKIEDQTSKNSEVPQLKKEISNMKSDIQAIKEMLEKQTKKEDTKKKDESKEDYLQKLKNSIKLPKEVKHPKVLKDHDEVEASDVFQNDNNDNVLFFDDDDDSSFLEITGDSHKKFKKFYKH